MIDASAGRRRSRRDGFALPLVVFLLFAVGVAGATAYQVLMVEAAMALTDQQGSQAWVAADAGLQRFMATEGSDVPDEVTYVIQDARAVVTPLMVHDGPFPNHTYRVISQGTFVDPRFEGSAAERTVSVHAVHERVPVELLGALVSPSTSITLNSVPAVDGRDQATSADCPEGGVDDIAGVVGGGSVNISGGSVSGSPNGLTYPGVDAVVDSLDVAWDVLTDPSMTMEHENTWPDFLSVPADSFPVIRYSGNRTVNCFQSGRGLLIVQGTLTISQGFFCAFLGLRFEWDGLVLAGDLPATTSVPFEISGALVAGLDETGSSFTIQDNGEIRYNSCNVIDAGRGLAHFQPMEGTWWEEL